MIVFFCYNIIVDFCASAAIEGVDVANGGGWGGGI